MPLFAQRPPRAAGTGAVMAPAELPPRRVVRVARRDTQQRRVAMIVLLVALSIAGIMAWGAVGSLFVLLLAFAQFNGATSIMETRWRLYGRRTPEAREAMRFPPAMPIAQARISFSIIVPALHEAGVIGHTLRTLAAQTHPHVQIIVSLHKGDDETIAAARAVAREHADRVMVIVNEYAQSSKPQQLNAALPFCEGDVVGVFDAEDDVRLDLLLHVEALIHKTGADIVQGGVQLVNLDVPTPAHASFRRRQLAKLQGWFCVHNVMEYFFWFSSRMFYQVDQGFVPLGGNTVFVRRELLESAGGWPLNLTEDCALGVIASVEHRARVVAAYEPHLATREETPSRVFGSGGLLRQRIRWDQGFLSVFLEGKWRQLPGIRQRLMACYILGMPYIQAFNGIMLPVSLVGLFVLKAPVALVMLMFLPLLLIAFGIVLQLVGLHEFSREFKVHARPRHYVSLVLGNYAYQLVLSWAALVAIVRLVRGQNNWFKTAHDGGHRSQQPSLVPVGASS